ncbi:MAG: cell division protein FtsX [Pseudomonadota bacterium]
MSKSQAQRGHSHGVRFGAWLAHHGESLRDALRRLGQRPLGSLLSMLVIAASLTIPITLLATLHGAREGLAGWSSETALLQVFLKPDISASDTEALLASLRQDPDIGEVHLITPEEGLTQLARSHALDGLLQELKNNPLPSVIELRPRDASTLTGLRDRLAARQEVGSARMDYEAAERLRTLIHAGEGLTLLFLLLLAPALAITVGNTIRLELERRTREVRLLQLIGATPAFIRRPLLYAGAMLGLGGTLLSLLFAGLAVNHLIQVAHEHGWHIVLPTLPPSALLLFLPAGAALGVLAAWLAGGLHLRANRAR